VGVAAFVLSSNMRAPVVPPYPNGSTEQTKTQGPPKPMNVTLGILTREAESARKFEYIAETTLKEVNAYAASQGSSIKFDYKLYEESTSEAALNRLISMNKEMRVRLILGFDSLDMCMSLSYVLTNGMLFMGVPLYHCPSSALPDDVMFRIGPNLRLVHGAIAALLKEKGIERVLVIQSASSWGDEAKSVMAQALGEDRVLDIRYYLEASYYAEVANYTEVAIEAGDKIRQLSERYGQEHTAVLLMAGDEGATILREAGKVEGLLDVQWIEIDEAGYPLSKEWDPVRSGAFNANQNVTNEALRASLISINLANFTDNEVFSTLQAGYLASKPPPDDRRLSLRDASFRDSVWIACLSVLKAKTTDGNALKDVVPSVADGYVGASGEVVLDPNGDRTAVFEYHQVHQAEGSLGWVKIGTYDSLTGRVALDSPPT